MKAILILIFGLFFGQMIAQSQNLIQTVRGTIQDVDSKTPLIGVQVQVIDSDPLKGAITDLDGEFTIENVGVGRVSLQVTYLGYEPVIIPDVQVISGKETILNIHMQESITQLNEVVISATQNGEPINEMALLSARSISSEETSRYAGGFNDPARILSNFAGVNNSQDGSADIIVRGNSPKYLQWRLEDVEIANPSHFADPAGVGTNSFSALNNNMISTSDFYTGAFPAEFGDAISGIYDVKLRTGNKDKYEGILGVGIIGTDFTLEGPFKKGYGGSFVANYRFTTTGLVDKMGLLEDIPGIPQFQDGSFKVMLPAGKAGTFSLFGLAGESDIEFEDVDPGVWLTPNERGRRANISEDLKKSAFLYNTGLNHMLPIGKDGYLSTTLSASGNGINDRVVETMTSGEEVLHTRDNFSTQTDNRTYRASVTFNQKLNARNTFQVGSKYMFRNQQFDIKEVIDDAGTERQLADFDENISTLRNFVSLKHRLNEHLTIVAGVHNMNVLYNSKSTIEPRLAANWQVSERGKFSIGYGMHSTMESVHNYFAKVPQEDGSLLETNKDLDLLKAHHFVTGYEIQFAKNMRAKLELYYQDLYNLPVENDPRSYYSTINESLDIQFVDLVNKGTGKNYGLELTVEKFFSNNYYYLVNASIFQSKYTALDGVQRNTAFNSNYLVNLLFGKEFTGLGKKDNQTFAINTKVFAGGGKRIIPLLRDDNGTLAVDPVTNQYYDNGKAFDHYLDDIYTITLGLSYKWQKPKRTHELFLNIDNVTNNKPRLYEYYDPSEEGSVGYLTPIGAFPNLMYRLYF